MDISRKTIEKPRFLEVEKFVESRTNSIAQLLKAIDNEALVSGEVTKGPRTAAQRLPRHMRRRAMAHDVRRFPKGMRKFASAYLISKHRKKPPSRFARRKPTNCLKSYERRKMTNGKWLETHIWHAKRFRMIKRWGFKIADRSYQRGFRSIIRDSNKKCVVRDRSFFTCITIISSDIATILQGVERLVNRATGLTFSSEKGLSGKYELPIQLYEKDQYPNNFIGPARFQWVEQKLVIWCHPAVEDTLINQLNDLFGLEKQTEDGEEEEEKCVIYSGEKVKSIVLSGEICRFRLFGPLSLEKLAGAIRLSEEERFSSHHAQFQKIVNAKDYTTRIGNGTVLSVQIEDPRTCWDRKFRPRNYKKNDEKNEDFLELEQPSTSFWNSDVRQEARDKKLSNKDFQKQNAEKIEGVKRTDSKIPILIIFRNTNQSILDGVEVIIPQTFGKDLWVSLQRCGVRASGLRDDTAAHLEAHALCSPNDDVDSKAGSEHEQIMRDQIHKLWLSRPFNRRCRFWSALSFKYPFTFNWSQLVAEWGSVTKPVICRDLQQLYVFDNILRGKKQHDNSYDSLLIPVKLDFIGRGRPKRMGIICIPTEHDLTLLKSNRKVEIIQESIGKKVNEEEEEMEVDETGNSEKRLEGFVSLEAAANEKTISLKAMFESDQKLDDKNQRRKRLNKKKRDAKKRRKLDGDLNPIEENEQNVEKSMTEYKNSANRTIIGRVVSGEQSILGGHGIAIGFICANTFSQFSANFGKAKSVVLVRNSTSKYYHPAAVSVIRRAAQI